MIFIIVVGAGDLSFILFIKATSSQSAEASESVKLLCVCSKQWVVDTNENQTITALTCNVQHFILVC